MMSDTIRQNTLPARGETDIGARESPLGASIGSALFVFDRDKVYQTDSNHHDNERDLVVEAVADNPTDELGIPEAELIDRLDKFASDNSDQGEGAR